MAACTDSFQEGKKHFVSTTSVDGNGNASFRYPSFKATKLSFNDSDVFPLLVKETNRVETDRVVDSSTLGQDVCTISVLPDLGNTSPRCTSQFTLMSFVKALLPSKNQMLLDTQLNSQRTQNCINVLMGGTDSYQCCVVDINVEKGSGETVTSHDEVVGNVKSESLQMHKVLQRQASLSIDKSVSERCHEAPTNRWRKYKRAASFDSRKIVIIFSILSCVGTLILIYLTLRVKQNDEDISNI
ncbi:hypothetical protein V5N11_003807 [Cardamine amara subsp. amara]|uniref:Uncharacterized protein n=1 Tax=Cardamine amara subsp. amara TaxID=228776 RepID=A0ABD0ZZC3_CARAN